jgi:hypothetical protein
MAGKFVLASNQKVTQTPPLLTTQYPFTVGAWFQVATVATACVWALTATGAVNHFSIYGNLGTQLVWEYWNGSSAVGTFNVSIAQSEWIYFVGRSISATNRRLTVLRQSGAISHNQNTTSVTISTPGRMCLGMASSSADNDPLEGRIAEFFFADADVQADGGQLDNAMVHQLAFRGPWSVPHLVPNIVEYRSLRRGLDSKSEYPGDDWQRGGPRPWVATNGPTVVQHPNLYPDYARPPRMAASAMVI